MKQPVKITDAIEQIKGEKCSVCQEQAHGFMYSGVYSVPIPAYYCKRCFHRMAKAKRAAPKLGMRRCGV